jgi:hypothetical protein
MQGEQTMELARHGHQDAPTPWPFMPAIAVAKVPGACGQRFQTRIVSRRRFIQISMWSYEGVIPAAWHKASNKLARKTSHVERFHHTLRQRVSCLVRETLSLSKKLTNHIGAITYFICHYNLTRAAA